MSEYNQYDGALRKMEDRKVLVDSRNMTKREFIANALKEPDRIRRSSLIMINDEMGNDEALFYKSG